MTLQPSGENTTEQQSETARCSHNGPDSPGLSRAAGAMAGAVFLFFGVFVPALTIGVEMTTRICAAELFDPLPTTWHFVLVSVVPMSNLLIWLAVRGTIGLRPKLLGILSGISLCTSFYYSIIFLPITPLALIALLYLIGVLPLAPLFSFIAALKASISLRRKAPESRWTGALGLGCGVAVALLILTALEVPGLVTTFGMRLATSSAPSEQQAGIRMLRMIASEDAMLRACYWRASGSRSIGGWLSALIVDGGRWDVQSARKVFYQVTGLPFNSLPPPSAVSRRGPLFAGRNFDGEQGGDHVAGRVHGLCLHSSRMDGSIDPDAAVAYLEWTLEFRNESSLQREGRAQIGLPSGGVVSRVTLWIDGEEREAAIAGRAQARAAYEKVVRQSRDPILVTTNGPNSILIQCFPVPPGGGVMKARIGISAPLELTSLSKGALSLPRLVERNFSIPEDVKHMVWIESSRPLACSLKKLQAEHPKPDVYAVRGKVTNTGLRHYPPAVEAQRSVTARHAWAEDTLGGHHGFVVQEISRSAGLRPTRLVAVIDASKSMAEFKDQAATALASINPGQELRLLVASDEVHEAPTFSRSSGDIEPMIRQFLDSVSFAGGCDNVPALERAWDLASEQGSGAIVWIHGPQPVEIKSPAGLMQRMQRRPDGPVLFSIQASIGPNRVLEFLDGIPNASSVQRSGALSQDVKGLLARLGPDANVLAIKRSHHDSNPYESPDDRKQAGLHLVRLWAAGRVRTLLSSREPSNTATARAMAAQYRLVTPVSGAVVLEKSVDYEKAGLPSPVPEHVPTIPEPEIYVLLVMALLALTLLGMTNRFAGLMPLRLR